jgi:hypothetical protein
MRGVIPYDSREEEVNMKTAMHKLVAHDGKYIVLPVGMAGQEYPNLDIPEVWTVDTVQKYPIGTKFVNGNRVYHYALANGTCNSEWGAYKGKKSNTNAVAPTQSTTVDAETGVAAGAAGSYYVSVTIDTEIGDATTGVLTANELAGGIIVVGNGSSQHPQMRYIVSHPALTSTGGTLTVKMDMPLVTAVTASTTNIELMENPFYGLKADGSGGDYVTYMGISAAPAVADGEYFWLQTWGICWITSDGATCDSAGDRTLVWKGNGSVVSSNDITVESGFQIAGVAMDMSGSGASNAPFVLLQMFP